MTRNISIDESPLDWIRQFLYEGYGIDVKEENSENLRQKIQTRIRKLELKDVFEYANYLDNHPEEVPRFLNIVSTNKTFFFREEKHWEFLNDTLIPEWVNRDPDRVNIWSTPCSTGEEPYTAAMFLEESRRR